MRVFKGRGTSAYVLCFDGEIKTDEINAIQLYKDGGIGRSSLFVGVLEREDYKEIPNAQEVFKAAYNIIKEMDEGTSPVQSSGGWNVITDDTSSYPSKNEWVLASWVHGIHTGQSVVRCTNTNTAEWVDVNGCEYAGGCITHWQPLPPNP